MSAQVETSRSLLEQRSVGDAPSKLHRGAAAKLEDLDAERGRLVHSQQATEKELAALVTSQHDPATGGRGWPALRAEALVALKGSRETLFAHAERLYSEAGAKHGRHYVQDMRDHYQSYSAGEVRDINTDHLVQLKVKLRGPEAAATQAAAVAALSDKGWLDAKSLEANCYEALKRIDHSAYMSRRKYADQDARSLELQRLLVGISNRLVRIRDERSRTVESLLNARALERAGATTATPFQPEDPNPGITVDGNGRPNVWVRRHGGEYERPMLIKTTGGNISDGNTLVMADGQELSWLKTWSRRGPAYDSIIGPDNVQLAVEPSRSGQLAVSLVTGSSRLVAEMDTSG